MICEEEEQTLNDEDDSRSIEFTHTEENYDSTAEHMICAEIISISPENDQNQESETAVSTHE